MPERSISLTLSPLEAADSAQVWAAAAASSGIPEGDISGIRILRKSIDARGRRIRVHLEVRVVTGEGPLAPPKPPLKIQDVRNAPVVVVVGAGPAGLFAALRLIELGRRPVILERGPAVAQRRKAIARIYREGGIPPEANYGFGEGGAGAFSDGKLYTRATKRGNVQRILDIFHFHGASEAICYEAHPHIGSNKLPGIIGAIRNTIETAGGEIRCDTRVMDVTIASGRVTGGVTAGGERVAAPAVILATGHSARDIYHLLHRKGLVLEAKPFAMGVRVEHPQALIDAIQYHGEPRGPYLPAAAYRLAAQVEGRGVYSFCMCPGGFIVPAATQPGEVVVNGMSPARRNSPFANAGIVVEVRLADIPALTDDPQLSGLFYQAALERQAFVEGGGVGQRAPAQRLTDFLAGRASRDLPESSYTPGLAASSLHEWLPGHIAERLREGMKAFEKKMRGFITREALLVAVESRTSSPVRIPRDPYTFCHPQAMGLFPCGEGAGYAGGIVSSAMDGEAGAEKAAALTA